MEQKESSKNNCLAFYIDVFKIAWTFLTISPMVPYRLEIKKNTQFTKETWVEIPTAVGT